MEWMLEAEEINLDVNSKGKPMRSINGDFSCDASPHHNLTFALTIYHSNPRLFTPD